MQNKLLFIFIPEMQPIFEANTYLGCIFAFKGTKFSTNQQMFGGIIKSPSPNEQFEQFSCGSMTNPIIIFI